MWGIFAFIATLPIVKGLENLSVRKNTQPYLGQLTRYDNKLFNHLRQKYLYQQYIFAQRDVDDKSLVGTPVWERHEMYIEQLRKEGYIPDLSFNCDFDDKEVGYNYRTLAQEDKEAIGRPKKIAIQNAMANSDIDAFLKAVDAAGGDSLKLLKPKPIDISNPVGEDWDGGYPKFAEEWMQILIRCRKYDDAKDFYYALDTKSANEWIFQFLDEFEAFPPTYEKRGGWKPYYEYKEVPPGLFAKCIPQSDSGWHRVGDKLVYDGFPRFMAPYGLGCYCNLGDWGVDDGGNLFTPDPNDHMVDFRKRPFRYSYWEPEVILPEFYLYPNRGYHYKYHALGNAYSSGYNNRERFYYADMDCQYKWIDPFSKKEWKFRYYIKPYEYPEEMRLASREWAIEMENTMQDLIIEDAWMREEYHKRNKIFEKMNHRFGEYSYHPPEAEKSNDCSSSS